MHYERTISDEFMIKPILETRIIELTNGNENFANKSGFRGVLMTKFVKIVQFSAIFT